MGITGQRWLDHFLIVVNDVEAAGADWEGLGFQVLPRMMHLDLGSSNRVIQLEPNYLELFVDAHKLPDDYAQHYLGRLALGEGHANACFNSDDLHADREALITAGLQPQEVRSARRPITMPDGAADETQSDFLYLWREETPYMSPFWDVHHKPETIFVAEYQAHANSAEEIIGFTCFSRDVDADAAYFALASGGECHSVRGGQRVQLAKGHWVDIITPDALQDRFGEGLPELPEESNGFGVGLTIRVRSLELCRNAIKPEVRAVDHDDGLLISASSASGTFIHFVEARS